MFASYKGLTAKLTRFRQIHNRFSHFNRFVVSEEVRMALTENSPIVALESTIITHGMPYPQNVQCASEVEAIVREQGAIPATIAIVKGEIKVGLQSSDLQRLGDVSNSQPIKASRRDLTYIVANKFNGGTTVASTLLVASKIGIPIFATGGIGGVHRGGETTFDISADLTELGRSNVAVVSSGIKSILDIPKTLEFLETQGVFVASFGAATNDFPAFYSRRSGSFAPYSVTSARKAAEIIFWNRNLGVDSGMLFAVPVPEEFALDEDVIDGVINRALKEAQENGIAGKEITPFLLGKIAEITAGRSLETNIALIKNNAKIAGSIAVELCKLHSPPRSKVSGSSSGRPVVIGGSNLDCSFKLNEPEIKMDGRMHFGRAIMTGGGVARNIYEALCKLKCHSVFMSAVGDDPQGNILKSYIPDLHLARIKTLKGHTTGQCTVLFDSAGECKFLAGDMEIHKQISAEMILENEDLIKSTPLVIIDGNLPISTIEAILKLAERYNVPVFYEPTDVEISSKPFETAHWRAVKFITPNYNELKHIASHLGLPLPKSSGCKVAEAAAVASAVAGNYIDTVIVTLGDNGVIVARKGAASEPMLTPEENEKVGVRHYPTERVENLVNVSGAGDCLASGIIAGMLKGLSEETCIAVGLAAARSSLFSEPPVAPHLIGPEHPAWTGKAPYTLIKL